MKFFLFCFTVVAVPVSLREIFLFLVWMYHRNARIHVYELLPSTPEEDVDPRCFGDLRSELLARGWREEHPGIFSRDPFARRPPPREYHNRHSGIFRKKAR